MARLIDRLTNRAPAPITTARRNLTTSSITLGPSDTESQLEAIEALSTLYKVIAKRAASVAQVEWKLYQKPPRRRGTASVSELDERIEVESHPALDVWTRPNAHQTRTRLVKLWSIHMDLAGEAFIAPDKPNMPTELWNFRPDRMTPRSDPAEFLLGWTYKDPDGHQTVFDDTEVWQFQDCPHPTNPHRGIGPVQSLLVDVRTGKAAADWNLNFFLNSAEPGGIIEAAEGLTDDEFDDLARRWNEQHRGVRNAHRVAVIEHGKWVPRAFSMRDMEFTAGRNLSREIIREAFAMPETLLGLGENVNRATAQAAWAIYLEQEIGPRLDDLREWLNTQFLPRFGRRGQQVEFDFVDPVPTDREAENEEIKAKAEAAKLLVEAGYNRDDVLVTVGLPPMEWTEPAPPAPAEEEDEPPQLEAVASLPPPKAWGPGQPRNADPAPTLPPVTRLQEAHDRLMADLVDDWETIEDDQKAELVAIVLAILTTGNLEQLANLQVNLTRAQQRLAEAMIEAAEDGAAAMVDEAKSQGVDLDPTRPDHAAIVATAGVVAGLIAKRLTGSAASTAMRANSANATPQQVADAVAEGLANLSTDGPKPLLGGALTGSQNDGRLATVTGGPVGAVYANETNDSNTCGPCRAIDGQFLGWTDDLSSVLDAYPGGGFGGYVDCDGRERCRGTTSVIYGAEVGDREPNTSVSNA